MNYLKMKISEIIISIVDGLIKGFLLIWLIKQLF
jgi:hypothetical protein